MSEMNKVDVDELEEVAGGKIVTVTNNAMNYANVRYTPGLNGKVVSKIYNGTKLKTTGRRVKKDGYVWYEASLLGGTDIIWIAGNLIGL